jgi:hypothetical protein
MQGNGGIIPVILILGTTSKKVVNLMLNLPYRLENKPLENFDWRLSGSQMWCGSLEDRNISSLCGEIYSGLSIIYSTQYTAYPIQAVTRNE